MRMRNSAQKYVGYKKVICFSVDERFVSFPAPKLAENRKSAKAVKIGPKVSG